MKKILKYIIISFLFTSCYFVSFNNINKNKGSIILSIQKDSAGTIMYYNYIVKDTLGNYKHLIIDPQYNLFEVGDTIN